MSFHVEWDCYEGFPVGHARDWGAISEPVSNPWKLLEEKKEITNEELKGKMLYISNSIITLLKMRGL